MKILLTLLFFVPIISFSQENATTESGKKVILMKNGTWKYAPTTSSATTSTTFSKKTFNDSYALSDVIEVENGKDEKVKVTFTASIEKTVWDELMKSRKSEYEYFGLIAKLLTINAKYTLKNTMSFEPLTKQFFIFNKGKFICDYKMMGRNGYGNMIETSALVEYEPKD